MASPDLAEAVSDPEQEQEQEQSYKTCDDAKVKESTDESEATEGELGLLAALNEHFQRPVYTEEIGPDGTLDKPDVDITLHPSRAAPVAGELWSVFGEVHNRSTRPIWIVDVTSTIALAPEMYGRASQKGSIGAFFPTIKNRPQAEVVRIDPGASYSVVWKLSPTSDEDGQPSVLSQVRDSLKNFSFFNPGAFKIFATIHIWSVKPKFTPEGRILNIGTSYPVTVYRDIDMAPSPWVLIVGAALGGLLCFIMQALYGGIPLGISILDATKNFFIGSISSVLLAGVATILISRLSTTDFLIVICLVPYDYIPRRSYPLLRAREVLEYLASEHGRGGSAEAHR